MSEVATALGLVAPYFNLVLAVIAIILFIKLFITKPRVKRIYMFPWKLIFFALIVYIIEEITTILRSVGLIDIPVHINGFFELVIIVTIIYVLLLQKEFMKKFE